MADAVTSQTLSDGDRIAVVKFTNISDGTGESSVAKVDISALAASNTGLTLLELLSNKFGMILVVCV